MRQCVLGSGPKVKSQATVLWRQTRGLRLNRGTKLYLFAYPGGDALVHALLEGGAEGAVAPEAALAGQLLRGEGTLVGNGFIIEIDKMADAQPVDVGVVGQTLLGEILAEIVAVHTDGCRELR